MRRRHLPAAVISAMSVLEVAAAAAGGLPAAASLKDELEAALQLARPLVVMVSLEGSAPTLLFLGNGAREVAHRLQGSSIPDFYGAYLERRLQTARLEMAAAHR